MPKTQLSWFSQSSFANAVGHFGDASNGSLLGPGLNLWDLSAIKNFNMGEHARLQIRGEFFNAFNHNSFASVDQRLGQSQFGQATSSHDPRVIQLGGKINF
jgi:hypothetical protein